MFPAVQAGKPVCDCVLKVYTAYLRYISYSCAKGLIGQFQQDICLWGMNQDPKDSKDSPLYAPGTQVLIKVWKDKEPKGSTPAHMEGPPPCNPFYPHSSQGTRTRHLDSLLTSQAVEENRRGHSIHL